MSATTTLPVYRIDMNVAAATTGWVLGASGLGHGTILHPTATAPIVLAAIANPDDPTLARRFIDARIQRGRSGELGPMQAGTMALTLDNTDGAFSPDNAASPYYPNIMPMRQIVLSARYSPGMPFTPLYSGYVERVQPVDAGPVEGRVTIECSDWLSRAGRAGLTDDRPQEADAARFAALVGSIGSDTHPATYYGGVANEETMAAKLYQQDGLSALSEIAEAARGTIFQRADGTIAFRNRFDRFQHPGAFHLGGYYFDQVGLNAAALAVPYASLDYDLSMQGLLNDIHVTLPDGEATATDTNSVARYGTQTMDFSNPLLLGGRAADLATTFLGAYHVPQGRVHGIVVDGDLAAPLWDTLFGIELGDTVRVVKRQPANLGIDRTMFVEQIAHEIVAQDHHTISYGLSDRQQFGAPPWRLGYSRLSNDTYLVY